MSAVFEGYERQYCEISASLSRKTTTAAQLDGEQKKQRISEIKTAIEGAEVLIRKMDLEARSLPANVKAGLLAKLREYTSDLSNLKGEVKRIESGNSNQSTREDLLESGMADTLAVHETIPQSPAHPSTWIIYDGNSDTKNHFVAKNVQGTGAALLVVLHGREVFITYDTRLVLKGVESVEVLCTSDSILKCIDIAYIKVLGSGDLRCLAHMVSYTQELVEMYIAEGQVGPILLHLATHFNNWSGVPISHSDSTLLFVDPTALACGYPGYRLLQIQAVGDDGGVSIHYPKRWVAAGSAADVMTKVMMDEPTIIKGRKRRLVDPEASMSRAMQAAFNDDYATGGVAIIQRFRDGTWSKKKGLAEVKSSHSKGLVDIEEGKPPLKIVENVTRAIKDLFPFHLYRPV